MVDEIVFTNPQKQSNQNVTSANSSRIRAAKPEDAQNLQQLIAELMRDGKHFLSDLLPNTTEEEAGYIRSAGKNHIILVAEDDNGLAGWVSVQRTWATFSQHVGTVMIGVKADRQGVSIGTQLLAHIEPSALFMNIEKLELTVRTSNTKAVEFFTSHGYLAEGKKIKSVKINGTYDDEILMGKQLR